jgi:hypothetical protein
VGTGGGARLQIYIQRNKADNTNPEQVSPQEIDEMDVALQLARVEDLAGLWQSHVDVLQIDRQFLAGTLEYVCLMVARSRLKIYTHNASTDIRDDNWIGRIPVSRISSDSQSTRERERALTHLPCSRSSQPLADNLELSLSVYRSHLCTPHDKRVAEVAPNRVVLPTETFPKSRFEDPRLHC